MYILGLNAYHWDSSACLLKDGELVAASEEERFNRIKHWSGLPLAAIRFCLESQNISLADVDHIAIGHDPKAKLPQKIIYGLTNLVAPGFALKRLKRTAHIGDIVNDVAAHFQVNRTEINANFHRVEHHRSHLASAFFASPFGEAAILSIDAFGDFTSTMRATGSANHITVHDSVSYPHSIGMFYTALTQYLGFYNVGDEYKVMGLAPYGKPVYTDLLRKVIQPRPDGLFQLSAKYFSYFRKGVVMEMRNNQPFLGSVYSDQLTGLLGPERKPDEEITRHHQDIAASVQQLTEEIIFHLASHLRKKTGLRYLCVAGGVAQNSVANGKIAAASGFESVYVPSAGHDAGLSLGSALYVYNQVLNRPRSKAILSAYTGSCFDNGQIMATLGERNLKYQFLEDDLLFETVSHVLANEGVVGWFTGKAEFGPRALGGRSILADPRNPNAKELLNRKIKRRESFRPFAPSILKEYVSEYFDGRDEVPFMEKVFPIRKEKQTLIPAVTHVDGTGRLQTVDKEVSPRFYRLIDAFYRKTGIPILLNTSFNENEPIVNTPVEALNCFFRTKMDMLVLENCVLTRENA